MTQSAQQFGDAVQTSILLANSAPHYEAFGVLVDEFWRWTEHRYADQREFIDEVASSQGLRDELETLSTVYGPPEGRCLLALRTGAYVGGVAYRDLGDRSCEMKRLFVRPEHQGLGVGRALCEALITTAAEDGFNLMRLDTGFLNTEATQMYESMGFVTSPAHRSYSNTLMPYVLFMAKPL